MRRGGGGKGRGVGREVGGGYFGCVVPSYFPPLGKSCFRGSISPLPLSLSFDWTNCMTSRLRTTLCSVINSDTGKYCSVAFGEGVGGEVGSIQMIFFLKNKKKSGSASMRCKKTYICDSLLDTMRSTNCAVLTCLDVFCCRV